MSLLGPGVLVMMGDLNTHFDTPAKSDVALVLSSLSANGLVQNISESTHITRVDDGSLINCKVHDNHISDHYVVCASIRVSRPELISTYITYRNFKDMDPQKFASELMAKLDATEVDDMTANECHVDKGA